MWFFDTHGTPGGASIVERKNFESKQPLSVVLITVYLNSLNCVLISKKVPIYTVIRAPQLLETLRVLTACSSIMPVAKSAFLKKCIVLLTRKSNSQIAKDVTFNSLNQSPNHRPEWDCDTKFCTIFIIDSLKNGFRRLPLILNRLEIQCRLKGQIKIHLIHK